MSKSSKSTTEWDNQWQEYSKMLEQWKEVFQTFQNTTNEMQKKFNDVMEQAVTSSSKDTMKQFGSIKRPKTIKNCKTWNRCYNPSLKKKGRF